MLSAYLAIALLVASSMAIGRALFRVIGHRAWTGLEAALGLAALLAVAGLLAPMPGHADAATAGVALLLLGAAVTLVAGFLGDRRAAGQRSPGGGPPARGTALTALLVLGALSIPFLVNGRLGPIGVGVNNDLGLHLAWAEWLRSGLGPLPEPGYPIGPHGLAATLARVPGVDLVAAFVAIAVTIFVIIGITAMAAVGRRSTHGSGPAPEPAASHGGAPGATSGGGRCPGPASFELGGARAVLAATLAALSYLAVSYYAQAAFKEAAVALFALAFALALPWIPAGLGRWRALLVLGVLAAGIVASYSFPGLAWPAAIGGAWALTRPEVRRALRPGRLARLLLSPYAVMILVGLVAAAAVLAFSGRFGFGELFAEVAGSDTYGPVSPVQALGIWPEPNYRIAAAGWPALAVPATAIGIAALLLALAAHLRNRLLVLPVALAACALVYLASLPVSGDYSRAKALMILSPIAMLTIASALLAGPVRALGGRGRALAGPGRALSGSAARRRAMRIGWVALTAAFVAGAAWSSFLVLRDTRVAPPGHAAELRELVPRIEGRQVLYAGQDRYAAYALRGADAAVPIVEFPDDRITESMTKPFDTGSAYSPIDFDSFSPETLDRFPFVITGAAAWNSQAPRSFREIARTDSYVLWERRGPTPERHTLIEGTNAAAPLDCVAPENAILSSQPGVAGIMPTPRIAPRAAWEPDRVLEAGEQASVTLDLEPGRWRLSLQYFAPADLALEGPGLSRGLRAAADGQRPAAISLANDGQFWPAGALEVEREGPATITIGYPEPGFPGQLLGAGRPAILGNLVALPDRPSETARLPEACGTWVDWYMSETLP